MCRNILISAGEASGDLYASLVVEELRRIWPDARFFGCGGPRMRAAGVETVVDAASLAVVGLVEVVGHLPRIHREYRKLLTAAEERRPDFALLTDSPDFHLRVARRLHADGVKVFYLVAPQVWAWRKGRIRAIRRLVQHLLCIFPFEEEYFRQRGVEATYVGHPMADRVRPSLSREAFFRKHGLDPARPLIAVLPGSRRGESARHLPVLLDAVRRLNREQNLNFALPASATTGAGFFMELMGYARTGDAPVTVLEGESWEAMAHASVALAASGTVTVEAALLGTPMVTFYRVSPASWLLGKALVDVPYYSMVNLIAGWGVVPELMQGQMTGANLAREATRLLTNEAARTEMRAGLDEVRRKLSGGGDAPERAAAIIQEVLEGKAAHVS
jgi:lipid-A-disaccharide synthase